ncbi:MAG: hypothetical protein JXA43_00175 [Candidatus Diapherotrites archaeon]|nr:hypothetical protein [Candidatus Diapherotrites archaeon]
MTLIWTPFVPNISLTADNLFNLVGEGSILEQVLNPSIIIFIILAPLSYSAVSALAMNKVENGWIFSTLGMILGVLIGGLVFQWDFVYLVTGLVAAAITPLVFQEASVKFAELMSMNALRASWIGASKGITIACAGMFLILFITILPIQTQYFDTAMQKTITNILPTAQGVAGAQQGLMGLCEQYKTQLIGELSKPVARETVVQALEGQDFYESADDTQKEQIIAQQIAATDAQKNAIILQLKNAGGESLPEQTISEEEQYNQVYGAIINSSPLISELKNYFALLLSITIVGTVMMIAKITIAPLSGVYGSVFKRLFEILFK